MMRWRDLSYRHKVPLALSLVIVVTGVIVALILLAHAWRDAREQFAANAASLGRVVARSLVPPLLHDDPWGAFEILRTPLEPGETRRFLLVLDRAGRIYAASEPKRFPALSPAAGTPLLRPLALSAAETPAVEAMRESEDWILIEQPIRAEDGTVLGRLVLGYHRDLVLPRFHGVVRQVGIALAAALLVLLPLGWYAGNALAVPLLRLAECFSLAGRGPVAPEQCQLDDGADEIGLVGRRFREMLMELEEKRRLEKQMVATQRLAAIGRLTAGIAHEVNNPLGGMLNAISTYRRHGSADPLAERTLGLIERGLTQIRETVGALLVDARLESHALVPQDLDDLRTLISAQSHGRLTLDWNVHLPGPIPLPATPIRQILLNLLLNAAQAAEKRVALEVAAANDGLSMAVENDGRPFPPQRMEHLYEPFVEEEGEGRGLGLWIVYQLVRQLNGRIEVTSVPGHTRFTLFLPLEGA